MIISSRPFGKGYIFILAWISFSHNQSISRTYIRFHWAVQIASMYENRPRSLLIYLGHWFVINYFQLAYFMLICVQTFQTCLLRICAPTSGVSDIAMKTFSNKQMSVTAYHWASGLSSLLLHKHGRKAIQLVLLFFATIQSPDIICDINVYGDFKCAAQIVFHKLP